MIDCLPGLLNNIKMMLTIARYYNTTERMTNLFRKITNQAPNMNQNPNRAPVPNPNPDPNPNQIIVRCTAYLNEPGKLWEQQPYSR
eukprot:scaffold6638_cov76-Phaeocystis_antarctica.AAC.14